MGYIPSKQSLVLFQRWMSVCNAGPTLHQHFGSMDRVDREIFSMAPPSEPLHLP